MQADPSATTRVLVLGGTADGVAVADALSAAGLAVTYSLAGRTRAPRMPSPPVTVRTGGFGGVAGLLTHLGSATVDVVVDATHPFAATMSSHAAQACAQAGVALVALVRPGWVEQPGDDWRRVPDLASAASLAPRLGRRVLLTIGRQEVGRFAGDLTTSYVVRAVEEPEPLPPNFRMILERGPFAVAHELGLLRDNGIEVVVTKDSGGSETAAKLVAARELDLPVVVVDRPAPVAATVTASSVEEAVEGVLAQSG